MNRRFPHNVMARGRDDAYGPDPHHVYTLLPPHLADEWRRLREAKAHAETILRKHVDDEAICYMDTAYVEFVKATDALAAFEKQHNIGGGA